MLKKLFKVLIDTLTDPHLLSSRPHHGPWDDDDSLQEPEYDPYWKERLKPEDYCWVTNKPILTYPIYFSHEFDCYISEEGYKQIIEHECGEHQSPCEWCIIRNELSKRLDVLA